MTKKSAEKKKYAIFYYKLIMLDNRYINFVSPKNHSYFSLHSVLCY